MKIYLTILLVFLFTPVFVFAALEVSFSETIDVPVGGVTLTISSGSIVDSITFNADNLSIVLSSGASITINSADRRKLETNPSTYTTSADCSDTSSSITLSMVSGTAATVVVTPLSTTCSAGGGGGAAPAPPALAPPPADEPPAEEPAEEPVEEEPAEEPPAEEPAEALPSEPPAEEIPPSAPPPSAGAPGGGPPMPPIKEVIVSIAKDIAKTIVAETGVIFQKTAVVAKKAAKEVKEDLNTPAGKATTKSVISVSVATAVVQGVKGVVMPQVSTISDIYSMLLRLVGLLGEFLGIRKRLRKWGVAYDSVTKRPLDPVYVSILDEKGKEIEQRFTDMEGRFGFLVSPGRYRIEATKTHYSFPSLKVMGDKDELYNNIYHGEILDITDPGVIKVNIPMDPVGIDWNEEVKKKLMKFNPKKEILKKRALDTFFYGGLAISPLIYWAAPTTLNLSIIFIYLAILGLRQVGFKSKTFGRIYDKETRKPIPFAKIQISYPSLPDQRVAFGVSDIIGGYYILVVEKGDYIVHIQSKTVEGREIDIKFIFKSKERLINSDFWV